jgi:hypothetical protein
MAAAALTSAIGLLTGSLRRLAQPETTSSAANQAMTRYETIVLNLTMKL